MDCHQDVKSCVQVAVRIRPLNTKESETDTCIHLLPQDIETSVLNSSPRFQTIQVGDFEESSRNFTFDHVFPPPTNQKEFYSTCVNSLVYSCLKGYNATIFAYGQTGSGKTHTMIGNLGRQNDEAGVIPRAMEDIFRGLEQKAESRNVQVSSPRSTDDFDSHSKKYLSTLPPSNPPFEYEVKVQFLEVYGEEIHDLVGEKVTYRNQLSGRTASVKQNRTHQRSSNGERRLAIRDGKAGEDAEVIGACQAKVQSSEEAVEYLQRGMKMRRTEQTAMNAESSRSHAIFTLVIQQTQRKASTESSGTTGDSQVSIVEMKTSKIHFVDLAGSERIKSAKTKGKRMQEGININKGLFVLGNVISSLGSKSKSKQSHVPYRDSKLTRLLKGSLGGNHRTLMIGCASPSDSNKDETINTLRYANRAKNIKNHAKVNIDPSSKVINELQDQVTTLAMELLRLRHSDKFDDSLCPFSENFLDSLICASGTSSKSQKSKPHSTRPSSAPVSTNTSPIDVKPNLQKTTRQLYEIPEEKEEESKDTSEPNNNDVGRDQTISFYNLVRQSFRKLPIEHLEDELAKEDDVKIQFKGCRRLAWHNSLNMAKPADVELGDNGVEDFEEPDNFERHEKNKIIMYDSMCASLRDVLNSTTKKDNKKIQPLQKVEEICLIKTNKFETHDNNQIAMYDSMRGLLCNSLNNAASKEERKKPQPNIGNNSYPSQKLDTKDECFQSKHNNFETYKNDEIAPKYSRHLSFVLNPSATEEDKTKIHSLKHKYPSDSNLGSSDRLEYQNKSFSRSMNEYQYGYEALKLDNEIRLHILKVDSYRNEKKYLDDINDQLRKALTLENEIKQIKSKGTYYRNKKKCLDGSGLSDQLELSSLHSMEVQKSIIGTEGKITKLEQIRLEKSSNSLEMNFQRDENDDMDSSISNC